MVEKEKDLDRFGWQLVDSTSCLRVDYEHDSQLVLFVAGSLELRMTREEWEEFALLVDEVFDANE